MYMISHQTVGMESATGCRHGLPQAGQIDKAIHIRAEARLPVHAAVMDVECDAW
jgi:hypothetical protein